MKVRSTSLPKGRKHWTIKALDTGGLFCCPNTCHDIAHVNHTTPTRAELSNAHAIDPGITSSAQTFGAN